MITTCCDAVAEQLCGVSDTGVVLEPPRVEEMSPATADRRGRGARGRDVVGGLPHGSRASLIAEAQRVLRPGGRCLVIDTAARAGLGGLLTRSVNTEFLAGGGPSPLLTAAGFAAVRTLAERDGLSFVEGVKRNV